jgi:hypothetical protein
MNISTQKEISTIFKRGENLLGNRFNVTYLLNNEDPKNIKQKIFELLATGKGKLEITDQTVSLSISNLYERKKFYAEFQHNS